MIDYTLIRSNRKTIAIHITKNAVVEVRSPHKIPKSEIDKFVNSKEKWINKHLETVQYRASQKASFTLNYGDYVLYRGKEYPIISHQGNRVGFDGACFYLPENLPNDEIKTAAIQIYKKIAKSYLLSRIVHFSKLMNVTPTAVKVSSAKTRWGSCSGKNSISFSWRLIMAEDCLIDYVVIHELAHIKEHNHSNNFWNVVKQIMPDYGERDQQLKELQAKLSVENWD